MNKWPILVLVFFYGCQDTAELEKDWISTTVEEKTEAYILKKKKECLEKLLERVQLVADSIITRESRFDLPDSLNIPEKRNRPGQPNVSFPEFEKPSEIEQNRLDSLN